MAVNYHRVGVVDAGNPLHRLHTVSAEVFAAQLEHMQRQGDIVSLDDVRSGRDLAEMNFIISFDDVPVAAMTGIQMMLDRRLPVTVSVCTQLASHGWGMRDKVYCVDRYAEPEMVNVAMRDAFPEMADPDSEHSFYRFTKREDIDPERMADSLVNPLFERIEPLTRPFLDGTAYLSWPVIRELAENPLVTIANHTENHLNLVAMPRQRVYDEIVKAHHQISEQVGDPPTYLTIPFGGLNQRLAIDCIDVVHPLNYRGILWVGRVAILITGRYDSQLLQLTRLHAPPSLQELVAQMETLSRRPVANVFWQLPSTTHREPVTVVESSDPQRAVRYEMLARQGKDYASSLDFYAYQFTTNPAKRGRPDYYAVEREGRMESTAYNFHANFLVDSVTVPGVYVTSWRKLADSHETAAGRLVQRMITREAVVGVYHPSLLAAAAFSHWHKVPVWRLRLPVDAEPSVSLHDRTIEFEVFDDTIALLAAELMREAEFTLMRDGAFYHWRHECYPLAKCRYVVLFRQGNPVAYAVTLQRDDRLEISDWYAASTAGYRRLVNSVKEIARGHGVHVIEAETSIRAVADDLVAGLGASAKGASNFYHLNRTRLAEWGLTQRRTADLISRWPGLRFHESASTGDLLLR